MKEIRNLKILEIDIEHNWSLSITPDQEIILNLFRCLSLKEVLFNSTNSDKRRNAMHIKTLFQGMKHGKNNIVQKHINCFKCANVLIWAVALSQFTHVKKWSSPHHLLTNDGIHYKLYDYHIGASCSKYFMNFFDC